MSLAPPAEWRPLLRIALPVAGAFMTQQLAGFADTVLMGRLGAEAQSGVGVANWLIAVFSVLGMGCVAGVGPLAAQALGARDPALARRAYRQGLWTGALVALPIAGAVLSSVWLLPFAGIDPGAAQNARPYAVARLPSILPLLALVSARSYLQAAGRPTVIFYAIVASTTVHIPTSAFLTFGDRALSWIGVPAIGFDGFGIPGCGAASVASLCVHAAVLSRSVRSVSVPPETGGWALDRALVRSVFRVGLPTGAQGVLDVGSFAAIGLLCARVSATSGAAHNVAIVWIALVYMPAVALGAAATVRVGFHGGGENLSGAHRASRTAIAATYAWMIPVSFVFLVAPEWLAAVGTTDPSVRATAATLIRIGAVFQLTDGMIAVGSGILRGAGDPRWPAVATLVGQFLVGVPVGAWIGFSAGFGAPGLWVGLGTGLAVTSAMVASRALRPRLHRLVAAE